MLNCNILHEKDRALINNQVYLNLESFDFPEFVKSFHGVFIKMLKRKSIEANSTEKIKGRDVVNQITSSKQIDQMNSQVIDSLKFKILFEDKLFNEAIDRLA